MARSRCDACGATFSGVSIFDAHRVGSFAKPGSRTRRLGDRRCLNTLEMQARGMTKNDRGWWTSGEKMPADAFGNASGKASA